MGLLSALFGGKKPEDNQQEKQEQKNFEILKYDGIRARNMNQLDYAIRCFERLVSHAVVKDFKGRRIVDVGNGGNVFKLQSICKREQYKRRRRYDGADEDERRAPPHAVFAAIGNGAEQGEHEQGQDVIERHNDTRISLGHAELIG